MFHLVSCVPQNEMVVLTDDINGLVGSSNAGCDGTHGGFGYGDRNADGSKILEFADRLNIVICNSLFMKQELQLVTYAAGPVKSTVDYIIVEQEDKAKVRNVRSLQIKNMYTHTHTNTQLFYGFLDFVRNNPGEPVP